MEAFALDRGVFYVFLCVMEGMNVFFSPALRAFFFTRGGNAGDEGPFQAIESFSTGVSLIMSSVYSLALVMGPLFPG